MSKKSPCLENFSETLLPPAAEAPDSLSASARSAQFLLDILHEPHSKGPRQDFAAFIEKYCQRTYVRSAPHTCADQKPAYLLNPPSGLSFKALQQAASIADLALRYQQPTDTSPYAVAAQNALDGSYALSTALFCLTRVYIPLIPATPHLRTQTQCEHNYTNKGFCLAAIETCLAKWGPLVGTERLLVHIRNGRFDAHHLWPKYWGGGNRHRTLIDTRLHAAVHADFDAHIRQINVALKHSKSPVRFVESGVEIDDDQQWADTNLLARFLRKTPKASGKLRKIAHVRVKKGQISVGILWPEEPFCIPQLLLHEARNGAPDEHPLATSRRPIRFMAARSMPAPLGAS